MTSHFSTPIPGCVAIAMLLAGFLQVARAFDVDAVKPSVPRILDLEHEGGSNYDLFSGSGFVVHAGADYSVVATNCHVVEDLTPQGFLYVLRRTADGSVEARRAEIIAKDNDRDLALLKVPGFKAKELVLQTVEPAQAEDVYSIGYPGVADDGKELKEILKILKDGAQGVMTDPGDLTSTYLEASVSKAAVRRVVPGVWVNRNSSLTIRIVEHDVNIGHGNSGGPLFNAAGQVVGVNTGGKYNAKGSDVDKFSKASHVSALIDFLKSERIDFVETDKVATASGGAVTVKEVSGGGSSPFMLIVATGVAAVALAIALGKRQTIAESYTHYVRRSAAKPRTPTPADDNPAEAETVAPDKKPATPLCILDGENPEGGKQIRFVVSDKILQEKEQRIVIGRSVKQAHFCINNSSVSGEHLVLHCRNGVFQAEDRDSSNGTRINGEKIPPFAPIPLADGDKLEIGDVVLQFQSLT